MLSKTIKEDLQQMIDNKKEECKWIIDSMQLNEKDARKYLKIANNFSKQIDDKKKLVDKNDKQIKQLQEILNQM